MNCGQRLAIPRPGGAQPWPRLAPVVVDFSSTHIAKKRCMLGKPALQRSSATSLAGLEFRGHPGAAALTMWATGAPSSACWTPILKQEGPSKRSALPMRWIWVTWWPLTAQAKARFDAE